MVSLIRNFKNNLYKFMPNKLKTIYKSFLNYKILSLNFGQYNSIDKWACIDLEGKPIPWYTYPAIEFLNQIDLKNKSIFEFGSGNSTRFWKSRCSRLVSVEHDKKWFDKVKNDLPSQVDYNLIEIDYHQSINNFDEKFDVIIIDGKNRFECALESIKKLNEDGFIILDNSDWYQKTSKLLRDNDLIEIDFSGFGPINEYTWTTSFYLKRNVKFKPAYNRQPNYSIGSLKYSKYR